MGSCCSTTVSDYSGNQSSSVKVISLDGNLCQYPAPITVYRVLEMEPSTSTCILCNSDQLFYDDYVKAMDSDEELEVGQIYFVLAKNRLKYRLTATDMAALAVKASAAFMKSSTKGRRGRKKLRISPVLEMNNKNNKTNYNQGLLGEKAYENMKRFDAKPTIEMKRSGSVRKLQKNASRRAKIAIRSFRMRLNTIYEGYVAE